MRTNGRILGFDPREGDYSCSGTALDTPSHSIVLTAGHCVLEQGVVGRELTFIRPTTTASGPSARSTSKSPT